MANRKLSCTMLYRWFKCKLKPPKKHSKMTLVYAKIIDMFVCGAEPGGRGWGVGGFYEISSEINCTHI